MRARIFKEAMPVVLQIEAAECGLACLTSILISFGNDVSLPEMRIAHPTSLKGTSVAGLIKIAHQVGLDARALRVGVKAVDQVKLPAILHWGMNHFVVLEKIDYDGIQIMDPALGPRKVGAEELGKNFTGIAVELSKGKSFTAGRSQHSKKHRSSVLRGIESSRGQLIKILSWSVAIEVLVLASPFYVRTVMDAVLPSGDIGLLNTLFIAFLFFAFLKFCTSIVRAWSITSLAAEMNYRWANSTFMHMLCLPSTWYGARHVGDIVSRYSSIKRIQETVGPQFVGAMLDGVMSVLTFVALAMLSKVAFYVCLSSIFAYLVFRFFIRPWLLSSNRAFIASYARQSSILVESVRASETIKTNNIQVNRFGLFSDQSSDTTNKELRVNFLSGILAQSKELIIDLSRILVIWLTAYEVVQGRVTIGTMIASIMFSELLLTRAVGLIDKVGELDVLKAHSDRVLDIDLAAEETSGTIVPRKEGVNPLLRFENVSFRYSPQDRVILKDVSFHVNEGESLAVIGASGSGKTTIAKLLLGLVKPTSGEIYYYGDEISSLDLVEYRSVFGAVMQDDQIMAGTLAQNIALFEDNYNMDAVADAAKVAQIHDDIIAMPLGYYTYVGDMGSTLSGGQKQRLLLARAMYKKPRILLLDEATSHLDIRSETLVSDAIKRMSITRVIIAHRPETIASACRILDLETC